MPHLRLRKAIEVLGKMCLFAVAGCHGPVFSEIILFALHLPDNTARAVRRTGGLANKALKSASRRSR
jgi:hypothetical protein